MQAGSRVGCQEAHCAEGKWCWVKSQESHLYYVRQGCVEHNQVREKGAKVGDWTWGQFLWHPELQSLSAITDPIKLHPLTIRVPPVPYPKQPSLTEGRLPGRVSSSWGPSVVSSWGQGKP